jgi:hypothetical protein
MQILNLMGAGCVEYFICITLLQATYGQVAILRCVTSIFTTLFLWSWQRCSMVHGNTTDRRSLFDLKEAMTDDPTGASRLE